MRYAWAKFGGVICFSLVIVLAGPTGVAAQTHDSPSGMTILAAEELTPVSYTHLRAHET